MKLSERDEEKTKYRLLNTVLLYGAEAWLGCYQHAMKQQKILSEEA